MRIKSLCASHVENSVHILACKLKSSTVCESFDIMAVAILMVDDHFVVL